MDLYQIRYFVAISETGSFTKAAERLFVSQPSLSAGIKKLEQELGVILYERGGRKAVLTSAGKFFLGKAQTILNEYQTTLQELKGFQTKPTLRLGVLRTLLVESICLLISSFQAQYPNVLIELVDGTTTELQEWLEEGQVDLGITVLNNTEETKNSLTLFQQRRALAVSLNHPFAIKGSVRLKDIDGQPYIDRLHCELWAESRQLLESKDIHPHIVYRADREEWVISLIATGLGIAIMPEWENLAHIAFIPISDLPLHRTVSLVWRISSESEMLEKFCAFAKSHNWQA